MCGRYELHSSPASIALAFGLRYPPDVQPRYNIAPSQQVPIIRETSNGERQLFQVKWGLVPHWAKDPSIGNRLINARAETIGTSRGFRDAYRKGRCLIPASGFYEWAQLTNGSKQPVRLAMRDESVFAIAGLWSRWQSREGPLLTCTIITTEANELCQRIHDRMPVIVAPADYARWLDVAEPDPADLLRPYPSIEMHGYPVSTRVNSPKTDDAPLIEPKTLVSEAGSLVLI